MPEYTPGAHLEFKVWPEGGTRPRHRAYSLVSPWDGGARLEIAVQVEPAGSGGSRWLHGLEVGVVLKASGPRNLFEFGCHTRPPLLLADGIGVTPILCMARALHHELPALNSATWRGNAGRLRTAKKSKPCRARGAGSMAVTLRAA